MAGVCVFNELNVFNKYTLGGWGRKKARRGTERWGGGGRDRTESGRNGNGGNEEAGGSLKADGGR